MEKFAISLMCIGPIIIFGPLALAFLSVPLSSMLGCTAGGDSAGSCAIGGTAAGELVWRMAMMHWIVFMTFLPGIGLMIVGAILAKISHRVPVKQIPPAN